MQLIRELKKLITEVNRSKFSNCSPKGAPDPTDPQSRPDTQIVDGHKWSKRHRASSDTDGDISF